MKKFAIVALAFFVDAEARRDRGGRRPNRGRKNRNKEVDELYQAFQAQWNRSITSTSEYDNRVNVFEENKKLVDENNAATAGQGPDALVLGLNNFSD
jgi:hypothetical protein